MNSNNRKYLNLAGLVLGFVGSFLLALFGLPDIGILSEASYIAMETTPKIRIYSCISKIALCMVSLGFLFQFCAAWQFDR